MGRYRQARHDDNHRHDLHLHAALVSSHFHISLRFSLPDHADCCVCLRALYRTVMCVQCRYCGPDRKLSRRAAPLTCNTPEDELSVKQVLLLTAEGQGPPYPGGPPRDVHADAVVDARSVILP